MIKVLQIVHSLGMGGAETWLMELLRLWCKDRRVTTDFLLTSGQSDIFDSEAESLGSKLFYCQYGRNSIGSFTRELRNILRDGNYDAIHDHQDYASGWHFALGFGVLPPIRISHIHNPSYQIFNNYGISASRRLAARLGKIFVATFATHITGTSRKIITEYGFDSPMFSHTPKSALYCGIDTSRFAKDSSVSRSRIRAELGWPSNSKLVLYAGRIDRSPEYFDPKNHKNSAFAVDVLIECAKRDPSVHALFAGRKSDACSVFESRIRSLGLDNRIQFLGIRHDIEQLMLASDILIFPSRGEGLGMVAVEAQAAGLPVIASTAVPRECVVVPEAVDFLAFTGDITPWVDAILSKLAYRVADIAFWNNAVCRSAFSIHNSATALERLYRDAVLPFN